MLAPTISGRIPVTTRRVVAIFLLLLPAAALWAQQIPESTYQELRWRMIGPFRGGRTRAVAGDPAQPNILYIGAVNGGVWKTTDYGRIWTPIFDAQPTQSIGAIAVAPSDPKILYVASGEGLHRPDLSVGNGIYKSTDGGQTWTHLGLREGQQIPALAVDPRDSNRLFAAVLGHPYGPSPGRGVFLSTDGGQNWQKVLYKDENTGASDIEMDPSNPDVLYAGLWEVREGPWEDNNEFNGSGGGLYKSTDGGKTWGKLTKGLPENLTQINVAIAPSQARRLYAVVGTTEKGDYESDKGLGVFRSDDGGENWYRVTTDPRPAMRIGGGDLPILRVDPKNADVLYSVSLVTVRSTDGGKTWASLRGAPGGDDYQNIWIHPANPSVILLVSDQGAVVSVNGGETWSSWYNQPTAQFYHVGVSNTFPYKVCSGQQESGSVCISSRGNDGEITFRDWHPVGVIEYGYVAPDPLDPDVVYGAGRTEVSKFHWSTGQVQNITPVPIRDHKYRADRTEPIIFSPLDPHTLYYATNVLFKTTDGGENWKIISPDLTRESPGIPPSVGKLTNKGVEKQRGVIYALAPSFTDGNTLWAGTDDGQIWITRDAGKNWSNITPPELTPWSKVTQIEASHFDGQSAYASVSRFRIDDQRPYIYRTRDGGKSWRLIVSGLPDGPADTVREDPVRKGLLFAGTENSVWVSFDDGDHWQSLQLNLPHTSMRDLWIYENDLIVGTHGRSFWILDDIAPLRELSADLAAHDAVLFKPAAAYRVRRDTNTDTPLPPDEPAGQNPPAGAIMDYYLGKPSSGPVVMEILDEGGKVVRRYASDDEPGLTQAQLEKQLIPVYWVPLPKALSAAAGMHRWIWDLHYTAPVSTHYEYPIAAIPHDTPRVPQGPLALPGDYTVRLTVNGQVLRAPLHVQMDPRVKTPAVGLQEEFTLESRLSGMLSRSSEATLEARSVREQIKKLPAASAVAEAVQAFDKRVAILLEGAEKPAEDSKPEPTLGDVAGEASSLYGMVGQADTAPTTAQKNAASGLEERVVLVTKRWDEVKADIPALNQKLKAASLPEIHPEQKPEAEESGGSEE
jgi:photosystem II stability/assembly factor-like uncharacterized protein